MKNRPDVSEKQSKGQLPEAEPITEKKIFRLFLDGDNFRQYQGATYRLMLDWMKSLAPVDRWQVNLAVATNHSSGCIKHINEIMDNSVLPEINIKIVPRNKKNAADNGLLVMQKEAILLDSIKNASTPVHHVLASHDGDLIRKFSRQVKASGHTGEILNTMKWRPRGLQKTCLETMWKLNITHVNRRREGDVWELIPVPEWRWEQFIQDVSHEMVTRWFVHHPGACRLPTEGINAICQQIIRQFHLEKQVGGLLRELIHQRYGEPESISRQVWEKKQCQSQPIRQNPMDGSHRRQDLPAAPQPRLPVPQDFPDRQSLKFIRKLLVER